MPTNIQKLPVKTTSGSIDLIEIDSIYFLEADSSELCRELY